MQDKKASILFVSKHAVHEKMAMAGNQFFYHTLLSFCQDNRFDVGIITVQKKGEDLSNMQEAFRSKASDFSVALPRLMTLFTYFFYNTKLRIWLSSLRADWYLLDPIYRHFFKKAIKKANEKGFKPDIVVLEWTEVLFLEGFCKKLFPQAKIVVTEHDVSFTKVDRRFQNEPNIKKRLVLPFKQKELSALQKVDIIRVLSKDDQVILNENGIAEGKIRLIAPFFQKKNMAATEHYKAQVVFYGALGRKENSEAVQWFIEKVYKPYHLSDKVTFCIIGGGGDKLKMQYADLPGVRFTGFVEKPENIFVESLCMVVPLLNGGGIKIKVLEGMTCALPVLTNEIGIEGIGGGDGSEYLFCKTPKQYEDGILSLLSSPVLRREIGENARAWINEHFDYEKDLEAYKLELIQLSNKIC